VWAIEHINKNIASHYKLGQFSCYFLSLFYFLSIVSEFVTNIMSLIEALFGLKLFISLRVLSAGLYNFNTAVPDNGLSEPFLLQTNGSFPLRLSVSKGMFALGKICQKFLSKNLKANLPSSTRSLSLWWSTLFQPIRERVIWKLYYNYNWAKLCTKEKLVVLILCLFNFRQCIVYYFSPAITSDRQFKGVQFFLYQFALPEFKISQ